MKIDEAIKHCEEVMMENLEKTKDRNASDPIAINCFECAAEHRQLAEWLKDYKRLLEQEPSYNSVKTELEPCEDAVSRQAVLEVISKCHCEEWVKADIGAPIEVLPYVTPQPKMGRWTRELIRNEKGGCIGAKMICSECGNDNKHDEYMDYCPKCGTKMQEVEE